jgi:hypothetical protein
MLSILVVDPCEEYPQFDYQVWDLLTYLGTAMPLGRRLGEWVYVGRIYK